MRIPSDPIVFIGGLQRSGTTLVGNLLAQHPAATGLVGTPTAENEGQFVQDVYLDDHRLGDSRRGRGIRWAYHPKAHLTENDAEPDAGSRLLACWEPYWQDPAAALAVEKSPSNVTRTRFLQAAFADARFIVVTRHPVIQALAVRKWGENRHRIGLGLTEIIDHWFAAMDVFAADRGALAAVQVVRYEDLVADPQPRLASLAAFAGLPPAPLDTADVAPRDGSYLRYWQYFSGADRSAGFQALMPRRKASSIVPRTAEQLIAGTLGRRTASEVERRFGDRMAAFGYRMEDLSR